MDLSAWAGPFFVFYLQTILVVKRRKMCIIMFL